MNARWFESKNFGDAINPTLIEFISNEKAINNHNKVAHYIVVGSILAYADRYSTIWGAGFISKDDRMMEEPNRICAVRGPMTRNQIIEHGFDCPEIYGDPVLLLPLFYNPKNIEKKYELGFIPHYAEWNDNYPRAITTNPDILMINMTDNVFKVINQVLSCKQIISSALHGLIIADAYSIPSEWMQISNKVIGDGFKFRDYFAAKKYVDLDKLLNACPFRTVNK